MAENKNLEMFEDIEIPERLKPDNIAKMLEDSKNIKQDKVKQEESLKKITPSVKPKSKKMKIFATIAAGAVLIVGITAAFKLNQNEFPTVKGKNFAFKTELKSQQNYSDIYNTIKQINANANKTTFSFGDFLSGILGGGKKSEDLSYGSSSSGGLNSSEDYSTTHQQVAGVDEADIIKTDGNYIYYVSFNRFYIIKSDNGKLSLVSEIKRDYIKPIEMYLKDNKLILISQVFKNSSNKTDDEDTSLIEDSEENKYQTIVENYDITDKTKPKAISTYKQNGLHVSSRLIDNNLYISTTYYNYNSGPIENSKEIDKYIPSYSINGENKYVEADDICIPQNCTSTEYSILAGLDISSQDMLVSIKAVLGYEGIIYCSKDNFYIAGVRWNDRETKTSIARFSINKGKVEHNGYGEVNGGVNNQFSMDEYDGNFRIATTSTKRNETANNVYVLDKDMKTVGKLEDLAKNESIQSARFENNMLYLVTFEKRDPLFKIDLSNPKKPKVLDSLKINGYSSYLINYGDGKLLGFGVDADDNGNQTGLKLSMFAKDDKGTVKELVSKPLGTDLQDAYSQAIEDHKALLIDEKKNIIGIPVNFYDGIDFCNRYYLFKYTEADGFVEIGHVEAHKSNSHLSFIRGMYIGDKVYLFSYDAIISAGLNDAKIISSLQLLTLEDATTTTHNTN